MLTGVILWIVVDLFAQEIQENVRAILKETVYNLVSCALVARAYFHNPPIALSISTVIMSKTLMS